MINFYNLALKMMSHTKCYLNHPNIQLPKPKKWSQSWNSSFNLQALFEETNAKKIILSNAQGNWILSDHGKQLNFEDKKSYWYTYSHFEEWHTYEYHMPNGIIYVITYNPYHMWIRLGTTTSRTHTTIYEKENINYE